MSACLSHSLSMALGFELPFLFAATAVARFHRCRGLRSFFLLFFFFPLSSFSLYLVYRLLRFPSSKHRHSLQAIRRPHRHSFRKIHSGPSWIPVAVHLTPCCFTAVRAARRKPGRSPVQQHDALSRLVSVTVSSLDCVTLWCVLSFVSLFVTVTLFAR